MVERHATLHSRGIATLLQPRDRVSRMPDGFGDFCFWPKPFGCLDCTFDSEHLHPNRRQNRHDVVESDMPQDFSYIEAKFIPESFFPFLKLPKDIRDMIYGYCVEPFRNPWQKGGIKVSIGIVLNRRCHPFRDGYKMRVPIEIKPPKNLYKYSNPKDSQNLSDDQGLNVGQDGQRNDHNDDQGIGQDKLKHRHIARQDYDTIWSLSKVNHQIREEIGSVFWSNIYVDIDHWEYLLLDFLADRPAIHKGIKKLYMSWTCDDEQDELDYEMIDFCKYISDHLVLDELKFALSTSPAVAEQLLANGEGIAWVKACKRINAKNLKVKLCLAADIDDKDRLEQEMKMNPKFEVLLRPDVMRTMEPTEEDVYLMSRAP